MSVTCLFFLNCPKIISIFGIKRIAHKLLDESVREAYEMRKNEDILKFLLNLNKELYKKEQKDLRVTGPGLPLSVKNPIEFISQDYIKAPSGLM